MGKKSKRNASTQKAPRLHANERARESDARRREQKLRLEERRLDKLIERLSDQAKNFRETAPEPEPPRKKRRRGLYGAAKPAEAITLEEPKETRSAAEPPENVLEKFAGNLWAEPHGLGRELLKAIFDRAQVAHVARGRMVEAERQYRRYLALDADDHCGASGNLLLVLLEQGLLEDAEDLLQVYGPRAVDDTEEAAEGGVEEEGAAAAAAVKGGLEADNAKDVRGDAGKGGERDAEKIRDLEEVKEAKGGPNASFRSENHERQPGADGAGLSTSVMVEDSDKRGNGRGGVANDSILAYGQFLVSFITTYITKDKGGPAAVREDASAAVAKNPFFAYALLHARVFLDVLEDADEAISLAPGAGSALEAIYMMSTELLPLLLDTDGAVPFLCGGGESAAEDIPTLLTSLPPELSSTEQLAGDRSSEAVRALQDEESARKAASFLKQWNEASRQVQTWEAEGRSTGFTAAGDEDDSAEEDG